MTDAEQASGRENGEPSVGTASLPDAFFRQLFCANPDSISISRLQDGAFLEVSQGFERATGFTRDEVIGRTSVELGFDNEIPGGREALYQKRSTEGEVHNQRVALRTKSGEIRHLRMSLTHLQIGGEECSLTIAHDVTEHVRAEEAIQQSEALLRDVINASPTSLFVKDRDGRYILVNTAMAARNGLTPEQMIGMRDLDVGANWFKSNADIERYRQAEQKVIDTKQPLFIPDEEFVFRDGKRAWFQTTKVPLAIKGNPDCLLAVAVDITERKRTEARMRESEERYRLLFENAGVGIGYWTPDGHLISFNRLAQEYVGNYQACHIGQSCLEIFPGDLGRRTMERIRRAATTSGIQSYEDHLEFGNRPFWFLSSFTAVRRPDGQVAGVQVISQDIADMRRAELELRKLQSLLEQAEALANIGSWEWNLPTGVVFWSPQLYSIYGRDPRLGPPTDDQWWDLIHPDDRERLHRDLDQALSGLQEYNTTFRIVRANDGDIRHVQACGTVVRNDAGEALSMTASAQDVTQRMLGEQSLRESERMLRALSDAAFDAVFLSDKGTCLDQNLTAEKMFGYTRKEAIGRLVTDWIASEDRDVVMQHVLEGREGKYEVTARRKDGSTFPCAIQARMFDHQGRRVRYTALSDITEQKQAEEDLRESRLFADNLIQTASVMIVGLDLKGSLTLFNPAGERITGYSQDEVIGKNWFTLLLPPNQRAYMLQRFRKLLRGGGPKFYESPILIKGGEERIIAWSNNKITVDGSIIGSISFGIDITERRQIERQLREVNARLAMEHEALLDKNVALREILDHIEDERREYKHQLCAAVETLFAPVLEAIEKNNGGLSGKTIALLRDGLDAILKKDIDEVAEKMRKLSPRELDICESIREGRTSKQIAVQLGISAQTVHKHRQIIRKKLQLNNKAVNLASYLRSRP